MKQIIHVNQQVIAQNRRDGTDKPPIIARTYRGAETAREMELRLPDGTVVGKFVYSPHEPLRCGARLWLELDTEVCRAYPLS